MIASILALSSLPGCGPDEQVVAERDSLKQQLAEVREELEKVTEEREALSARLDDAQGELETLRHQETWRRLGIEDGGRIDAVLSTSMGRITCRLWPDKAPATVLNFVELAEGTRDWQDPMTGRKVRRPLYDGTIFHRVIPGFMIQGGDPLGNGTGGPGYRFPDEVAPGTGFDEPGLLAMANAGPDTNGSQFFITDSTPHYLDGKHTIFGRCEPLEVVRAIAGVERCIVARGQATGRYPSGGECSQADRPRKDVVLRHVGIERLDADGRPAAGGQGG